MSGEGQYNLLPHCYLQVISMKTKKHNTILNQAKALAIAEECAYVLKERFGVQKVYLFGSVTGESPWHDRSDIDIAVEGLTPQNYLKALSTLDELLPLGLEIDLITMEDASPKLMANILGEKKMPENSIEAMKQRIANELQSLERVVRGLQTFLSTASSEPSEIEIRGVASYLHDFYSGIERIFERIAVTLDGGLPAGEHWHQLLLQQMEEKQKDTRPAVIDRALSMRLLDYLKFRHRFRHTYGDELLWKKLRPLTEGASEMFEQLRAQLDYFENQAIRY